MWWLVAPDKRRQKWRRACSKFAARYFWCHSFQWFTSLFIRFSIHSSEKKISQRIFTVGLSSSVIVNLKDFTNSGCHNQTAGTAHRVQSFNFSFIHWSAISYRKTLNHLTKPGGNYLTACYMQNCRQPKSVSQKTRSIPLRHCVVNDAMVNTVVLLKAGDQPNLWQRLYRRFAVTTKNNSADRWCDCWSSYSGLHVGPGLNVEWDHGL
jgi:hypothetical protein